MGAKAGVAEKPLTAGQQVWLEHLKRCDAQRCSSAAYAREHGLSVTALYTARKELTQRGHFRRTKRSVPATPSPPVTLVPVRVERPQGAGPSARAPVLRVLLPNEVVIEVPEGVAPARCEALVKALVGVRR